MKSDGSTKNEGLNLQYFYGLRMAVQVCYGKHCNGKGDEDYADAVESFRIQDCYSSDDDNDNSQVVCYFCRAAGLTAGSTLIIAYFFLLVATVCTALRLNREGLLAFSTTLEGTLLKPITIGRLTYATSVLLRQRCFIVSPFFPFALSQAAVRQLIKF